MKKIILAGLLLLMAAFGGWYFVSPSYALMSLRDAAQAGDGAAMENHIDFPALRESLKIGMKQKMAEQLMASDDDPMAALGMAMADKLLDPMVDGFVNADGLAKLIQRAEETGSAMGNIAADAKAGADAQMDADGDSAGAPEGDPQKDTINYKIQRSGLSEFTVIFPDNEKAPPLIFKRDGLSWKLSEIDISQVELPGL